MYLTVELWRSGNEYQILRRFSFGLQFYSKPVETARNQVIVLVNYTVDNP